MNRTIPRALETTKCCWGLVLTDALHGLLAGIRVLFLWHIWAPKILSEYSTCASYVSVHESCGWTAFRFGTGEVQAWTVVLSITWYFGDEALMMMMMMMTMMMMTMMMLMLMIMMMIIKTWSSAWAKLGGTEMLLSCRVDVCFEGAQKKCQVKTSTPRSPPSRVELSQWTMHASKFTIIGHFDPAFEHCSVYGEGPIGTNLWDYLAFPYLIHTNKNLRGNNYQKHADCHTWVVPSSGRHRKWEGTNLRTRFSSTFFVARTSIAIHVVSQVVP